MIWSKSAARLRGARAMRRPLSPACEALEGRVVLSAAAKGHLAALVSDHAPVHQAKAHSAPVIGTITGQVTKNSSSKPLKNVKVELIDSNGNVTQTVKTNNKGNYKLKIFTPGAYVVRQLTPSGFIQTSPTFANVPPSGALNPAPNAWIYTTGNNNPANGAVGPYAWDTIAPAGKLPFESPVNINAAPTDLSSVLKINYGNS